MLLMVRMKDGFWTQLEIKPKTLHQLFPLWVVPKSSSLMRQITQRTMYNSYLGHLLRSSIPTVDSYSRVTLRTRSSNHSTHVVRLQILVSMVRRSSTQQHISSREYRAYSQNRRWNQIPKFQQHWFKNISLTSDVLLMSYRGIVLSVRQTQVSLLL